MTPNRPILLDTGPLVAFLNQRDDYHEWACEVLNGVQPPLYTSEAVIAEACYILRRLPGGPQAVVGLLEQDLVWVMFQLQHEAAEVSRLLTRYADLPGSLADLSLVRLAEKYSRATVLTLDRDFHVYRKNRRSKIPLITPPGLDQRAFL